MNTSLAHQNRAISRFESRLESPNRWGSGSNPRFLQRRNRKNWRQRKFESHVSSAASGESWWKLGLETGIFATYFLLFLGSLWMLS